MSPDLLDLLTSPQQRLFLESLSALTNRCLALFDAAGRELVINATGCANHPEPSRKVSRFGPRVPISVRGTAVAYLAVCHDESSSTRVAEQAARQIADRLRTEIELRSLSEELVDRYEEVTLLYDLSAELTANFDPDAIAQVALERACRAVVAEQGMVLIRVPPDRSLRIAAASGVPSHGPGPFWDIVADRGRPLLVESGEGLPDDLVGEWHDRGLKPFSTGHLVAAPLVPQTSDRDVGEHIGSLGILALAGKSGEEPFRAGDLKLLTSIAYQTALALMNAHLVRRLQQSAGMRRSLETAEQVQRSLLPVQPPVRQGIDLAGRHLPALKVGGDYFDFFDLPNGQIGLAIADVSGHSLGAALLMASVRTVIRAELLRGSDPARALEQANRILHPDLDRSDLFVSTLIACYDPSERRLQYANAGHHPPVVLGQAPVTDYTSSGIVLGILPEQSFQLNQVQLSPGDTLVLYTDGLIEQKNQAEEQYGLERMIAVLESASGQPAEAAIDSVLTDLVAFAGPDHDDDVSIVLLRVV